MLDQRSRVDAPMTSRHALFTLLVGISALGATCKGKERVDAPPLTAKQPAAAQPAAPAVTDMEGVDLTVVEPERRSEVLRILNETYCYCGCPRTLAACLANRADCACVACSERMTGFILDEVKHGTPPDDVEAQLLEGFSVGYNAKPVAFDLKDQPSRGPAEAKHVLVEFADFLCPHCAAASEVLEALQKKRGDVRLVYFYFPLASHGEISIRAAEAAEEARVQGKFWELAHLLFREQTGLDEAGLERLAGQVGLDLGRFREAMKSHAHRERVLANKRLGESLQIRATPSFYVGGRPFGLGRTVENFEMRFDMENDRGNCK